MPSTQKGKQVKFTIFVHHWAVKSGVKSAPQTTVSTATVTKGKPALYMKSQGLSLSGANASTRLVKNGMYVKKDGKTPYKAVLLVNGNRVNLVKSTSTVLSFKDLRKAAETVDTPSSKISAAQEAHLRKWGYAVAAWQTAVTLNGRPVVDGSPDSDSLRGVSLREYLLNSGTEDRFNVKVTYDDTHPECVTFTSDGGSASTHFFYNTLGNVRVEKITYAGC